MLYADRADDLLLLAEGYLSLGYSVIPLLGDLAPDRPKAPALSWAVYQSRRASLAETHRWFTEQGFQGMGIVTGAISRLAVLDFDSPDLYQTFCAHHPDLAAHEVIQTRRGFHIYFQLPPHLRLPTRKGQGMDWLSDGCYVVARPTIIAGFEYKAVKGGMPHILTSHDLTRIAAFLDHYTPQPSIASAHEKSQASQALTAHDLQALYRSHVGQGRGRNQSLFYTSLTARDHGWSASRVEAALANLHSQTASSDKRHETERQRSREALHTIQSVFSRPARPPHSLPHISPQLPTRSREALYALKLTCVVRVIEGLREKGIQPGQAFKRQQARQLLIGIVGRDSIDNALHALTSDGLPLFEREKPSLEPTPASVDAANQKPVTETKKCFFSRAKKSGKIQYGRKSHTYIMPTNAQVCHRMGVRFSSSDPLQPDDLTSAKKTRQAAHRELVKRRPAQYPREWLAKRLGVSVRTIQHYDPELNIQVRPIYDEHRISWATLNEIPDFPLGGIFLQDEKHHRYPAKREIAAHLLTQGRRLKLMRQRPNFYSLDPPSVTFAQVYQLQQERKARQEQIEQQVRAEQGRTEDIPPAPAPAATRPHSGLPPPEPAPARTEQIALPGLAAPPKSLKPKRPPRLTQRQASHPLPNVRQESQAQRVYTVINSLTADSHYSISQATARRCIVTYGVVAVERALALTSVRRGVNKPAGFFITVLRSEGKYRA